MMIDGIPNRPLYFYQKDIIGKYQINNRITPTIESQPLAAWITKDEHGGGSADATATASAATSAAAGWAAPGVAWVAIEGVRAACLPCLGTAWRPGVYLEKWWLWHGGTPKSSFVNGCSIRNHPSIKGYPHVRKPPYVLWWCVYWVLRSKTGEVLSDHWCFGIESTRVQDFLARNMENRDRNTNQTLVRFLSLFLAFLWRY